MPLPDRLLIVTECSARVLRSAVFVGHTPDDGGGCCVGRTGPAASTRPDAVPCGHRGDALPLHRDRPISASVNALFTRRSRTAHGAMRRTASEIRVVECTCR